MYKQGKIEIHWISKHIQYVIYLPKKAPPALMSALQKGRILSDC